MSDVHFFLSVMLLTYTKAGTVEAPKFNSILRSAAEQTWAT